MGNKSSKTSKPSTVAPSTPSTVAPSTPSLITRPSPILTTTTAAIPHHLHSSSHRLSTSQTQEKLVELASPKSEHSPQTPDESDTFTSVPTKSTHNTSPAVSTDNLPLLPDTQQFSDSTQSISSRAFVPSSRNAASVKAAQPVARDSYSKPSAPKLGLGHRPSINTSVQHKQQQQQSSRPSTPSARGLSSRATSEPVKNAALSGLNSVSTPQSQRRRLSVVEHQSTTQSSVPTPKLTMRRHSIAPAVPVSTDAGNDGDDVLQSVTADRDVQPLNNKALDGIKQQRKRSNSVSMSGSRHGRNNSLSLMTKAIMIPLDEYWAEEVMNDPLLYVSPLFAAGVGHVQHVYDRYCLPDDAFMVTDSLHALAGDVAKLWVRQQRAQIKLDKPKATLDIVEKMLTKDMSVYLPGGSETERMKRLAKVLSTRLDKDRDGRVSRSDFIYAWQSVITEFFDVDSRQEALQCSVM